MRNKKLWSVFLALFLLCGAILGTLILGANAEGAVIYAVNCEVEGAEKSFDTVTAAMEAAAARDWSEGETLEIHFSGTQSGSAEGSNLLFGAKTIWRGVGDKLPITILGVDADRAATVSLAAGRVACANDYTFRNLLLDTKTNQTQFFAGSGNIVLNELQDLSGNSIGFLFADTFTADVYEGWTAADMTALKGEDGLIHTSLTLDDVNFTGRSSFVYYPSIAAVGAKYADNYTAKAADDDSVVITPATCRATIRLLDGAVKRVCGYWAQQPASVHTAEIIVDGDPDNLTAAQTGYIIGSNDVGSTKNDTVGDVEDTYKQVIRDGNFVISAKNCTISSLRILYFSTIETEDPVTFGNSHVTLENVKLSSVTACGNDDGAVPGTSYLSMVNVTDIDEVSDVYAFRGERGTEVYIDDYQGMKRFCGVRGKAFDNASDVKVTIKNTTVTSWYGALSTANGTLKAGNVIQTFENCIFQTDFYTNSYQISSAGNITGSFTDCTFEGNFFGGLYKGACKEIYNIVKNCTFKGNYVGGSTSTSGNTVTSVTNLIESGTFNGLYFGGSDGTVSGNVTNIVKGGTFSGVWMGAGVNTSVTGNVTNTISGGTFTKPAFGGSCTTAITGTIENSLSGSANFSAGFCGIQGTTVTTATCGAVKNHIFADETGAAPIFLAPEGVTFTYNKVEYDVSYAEGFAFLGGATYGNCLGAISNTVEAGTFGTSSIGLFQGGNRSNGTKGEDADGVSIYNTVTDGTFLFGFYGGQVSSHTKGEIRSEISGGTFYENFSGGSRSAANISAPITLTIKGDAEIHCPIYATLCGYTEDQSSKVVVNSAVNINIESGTFYSDIYALGNGGNVTDTRAGTTISADGSVNLNITGGTFHGDIVATSETPVESQILGTAQVTLEPKNGDITILGTAAPRFEAEKIVIKGAAGKICLGGEGSLEASSVSGDVNIQQVEKWKKATYVTLPAGHSASVSVYTAPGAVGYFETEEGENGEIIRINGVAMQVGASLVLTDRIAVKIQLSKDAVDAIDSFAYSFKLSDGTVLAEGGVSDLTHTIDIKTEFEYYTVTLKALGIGSFDTPIFMEATDLYSGSFSIATLSESAVSAWAGDEDWVQVAKSIVNLGKASKGEALPHKLSSDPVSYERKTPTKDAEALLDMTHKALLMSDAVGLRLTGTVEAASDLEGLVIRVNGYDVTKLAVIDMEGTEVTLDLFFSVYGMTEEFTVEIKDQNGANCLTLSERLDALAASYGKENTVADSLLNYIQATGKIQKATPTLQYASQEEIALLNSYYEDQLAYYGDIHSHPGGGIVDDGKQPLSVWKEMTAEIDVDFYAAMNHKQVAHMLDADWDDTVFIGGTEPATTIDGRISVHYNIIIPDYTDLLEILELFPEYNYTGGTGDIELTQGTFSYPKFTRERFLELIAAVKERGGLLVNVHPKQQYTSDDPLDYYYTDYMGLEVFYSYEGSSFGQDTKDNYKLWTDLLAVGKRVWATAGSDSHRYPVNTGLTTLYSAEQMNTAYVDKLSTGNFVCGFAGIRMAIGDTQMGSSCDFAGKKLVFSVGDFHSTRLAETRMYRVNVITDEGVVFTAVVDGTKTTYFSLDADESAAFYRIEILDEEIEEQPVIAIGNPIWND